MMKHLLLIILAMPGYGTYGRGKGAVAGGGAASNNATATTGPRMEQTPKALEDVGIDEHLSAQVPLNLSFTDSDGKQLKLGQLIDGRKPTILTFNYSTCPMLCSLQLDGLVDGLKQLNWQIGNEYNMLTISIDPKEDLERTRQFKAKYMAQLQQDGGPANWHFVVGDEASVQTLTRAVGFKYKYVPEQKEYAHTAAIVLVSPTGVVSRYLYGVVYPPRDLRFGLMEAAEGKVGSTVDQILFMCFHFDANAGRYTAEAVSIMRVCGVITLVFLGGVLGLYWYRERRGGRRSLRTA